MEFGSIAKGQPQLNNCFNHSATSVVGPKRKRHYYYYEAAKKTEEIILDYKEIKELIDIIERYAFNYIEEVEDKIIVLHKNDDYLILPYITRFSKEYIERIRKMMKKLGIRLRYVIGRHIFLTITFRPREVFTLKGMKEDFVKAITYLLERIKKKYKYLGVIKCFEFTKSGLIHCHILILNIGFIDPRWLSRQLELLGLGKIKKIKEFKNDNEAALMYFFKYLMKSFKKDDEEGVNRNLVISWALNLRSYSMSHLLYCLLECNKNSIENKGWIYEGVRQDLGVYGIISSMRYYELWGAG